MDKLGHVFQGGGKIETMRLFEPKIHNGILKLIKSGRNMDAL